MCVHTYKSIDYKVRCLAQHDQNITQAKKFKWQNVHFFVAYVCTAYTQCVSVTEWHNPWLYDYEWIRGKTKANTSAFSHSLHSKSISMICYFLISKSDPHSEHLLHTQYTHIYGANRMVNVPLSWYAQIFVTPTPNQAHKCRIFDELIICMFVPTLVQRVSSLITIHFKNICIFIRIAFVSALEWLSFEYGE